MRARVKFGNWKLYWNLEFLLLVFVWLKLSPLESTSVQEKYTIFLNTERKIAIYCSRNDKSIQIN
jgi:hypothetical protein